MMVALMWDDGADQTVPLPSYQTKGAAGADVRANFGVRGGSKTLAPGERALIPTGLRMAIPDGMEIQMRPRSGLALKNGITMINAPGTIDSDYRGPVGVLVVNLGQEPFEVAHGMRIAQMVLAPVVQARFSVVKDLDETARGSGGFGSTGVVT
ncbi:MAG: dUTP diphosphatase [Pseudomonadota bacterium]